MKSLLRHRAAVACFLLLAPGLGAAGGSADFADVDKLLRQKPAIRAVLLQSFEPPDTVYAHVRLGPRFTRLGGQRLGPYEYEVRRKATTGKPQLRVTVCTRYTFLDAAGRALPEDGEAESAAASVRETVTAVILAEARDARQVECP